MRFEALCAFLQHVKCNLCKHDNDYIQNMPENLIFFLKSVFPLVKFSPSHYFDNKIYVITYNKVPNTYVDWLLIL